MIPILKYTEQGELKQVDEIAERDLYKGIHSRKAENDEERFVGTCTNVYGDILEDAYSYILIPYDEGYREFVINHTEQYDEVIDFEADASYFEFLKKSKPCAPQSLEKVTLKEAMDFCLQGTRFDVGTVEYAGTATVKWTDYNSPYDILKIICTAFNVQFEARIEVSNTSVVNRYIDVRLKGALFNGKEIVRGKDLISLKRTVDKSEIVTALFAVGPDPEEGKQRITTFVTDDNAQERWGEPDGRYRWDVYSPETENNNMTLKRLTTLAKTALNKRINAAVSYEIEQYELEYLYPHEKVRFGDLVRIKDVEFKPPLYAEAEVIEMERNIINPSNTKYVVGSIKEFKESDLLQRFGFLWVSIKRKLEDNFNNVGTIVNQVVADELQYVEKKILKSQTEPEHPVDGMYWYDTSNERVGVLKKRIDGEWINVSEEERNSIGGLSREVSMYRALISTFENLAIQHQQLYRQVTEITDSPYLISDQLRNTVNDNLNALIGVYNNIKSRLDSINEATATIGFLIDTQALFQDYRAKLLTLDKSVQTAKVAIDARLKTLQRQYTDEKFANAMKQVADTFGIQQDEEGRFIGPPETVAHMIDALKTETQEEMSTLLKKAEYETDKEGIVERLNASDSERKQLSNLISDRVTLSEYKKGLDSIKIGGVNLLQSYNNSSNNRRVHPSITSTHNFTGDYWATTLYTADYLREVLEPGEEYTYSYELEISRLSEDDVQYSGQHGIIFYSASNRDDTILSYQTLDRVVGNNIKVTKTFIAPEITDHRFVSYSGLYTPDGRLGTQRTSNFVEIRNLKLEKGNKATDWTPAPEDINSDILDAELKAKHYADNLKHQQDEVLTTYETRINQNGKDIEQRATKEEYNSSKQLLDKTIAQVVTSAVNGVSASYNENGTISDIILDKQGISLNSHLININDGDVSIQNGITMIKDLVANKITSGQIRSNDGGLIFDIDKNVMNVYESGAVNFYTKGRISFNSGNSRLDIFQQNTSDGRNVLHMGGDLFAYGTSLTDPNREAYTGFSIYPAYGAIRHSAGQHLFTAGGTTGQLGWGMDLRNRNNSSNPMITLKPYWESGNRPNFYLGYNDAILTGIYTQNLYGVEWLNEQLFMKKVTYNNRQSMAITNGTGGWGLLFSDSVYIYNASTNRVYTNLLSLTKM
ncbi:phage tail spike protein [Staphylococcus chromogenes]|uniref:phage tail spike protein n=1 Tax=Staphylococcus chromogenes TaxID=46126 RepID=UPI00188EF5BB|nr:phage tail spike protein [Staphylococcus chromogenes]